MTPLLLVWALGCSEDMNLAGDFSAPEQASNLDVTVALRLDVLPSAVRDAEDELRVLPESRTEEVRLFEDRELGSVTLGEPQPQTGSVVAWSVNPTIGVLPGREVPVQGTVFLGFLDSPHGYATQLTDDGRFEGWVTPERQHRLQIVPDDPMLPMFDGLIDVGVRPLPENLDLGTGVPVYGRILSASGPVAGGRVYVETADGRRSAVATADDLGFYQVRVVPGTWTVVSLGRELNQDPVLRQELLEVGDAGTRVDFTYPTDLTQVLAEGRAVDPDGAAVNGATVRLVSTDLAGFDGSATWSTEVPVAGNGVFLAKVVPGTYEVQVIPPPVSGLAPTAVSADLTRDNQPIGDVAVNALVDLDGVVVDTGGNPLADAQLTCTERSFDHDSYTAFSDSTGHVVLPVSPVEVACDVVPPGERTDLAALHTVLVPDGRTTRSFELTPGQAIRGEVRVGDTAEAFAVVEVHAPDGELLGFDITDEDGRFDVRVDLRRFE